MELFYQNRDNLTLKEIVASIIEGVRPEDYMVGNRGKPFKTKNDNLYLLPGHLNTSDLDSQISVALKIASGVPATRNIPGSLPKMLSLIGVNYDYIIYDLSPNVGGLNQVILMSSDYFIVPTSPDYFCLQAVNSLKKNIIKWHSEINAFRESHGFDSSFSIKNKPKFLGAVQQRYRPRYEKPAKSFQGWINKIRDAINMNLVPPLEEIGCVASLEKVREVLDGTDLNPYDLAHISDFNSLIAISQKISKPIFALTDQEIKEHGKVFGHAEDTMLKSRDRFSAAFGDLGDRVLRLTE